MIGSYESLYGYTSAVLLVLDNTIKLFPKQQVSVLLSDSFLLVVPGTGSLLFIRAFCCFITLLEDLITSISPWPLASQ